MADQKSGLTFNTRDLMTLIFYGVISYNAFKIADSVDRLNVEMAKMVTTVGQHEKRLDKGGL